MARLWCRTSRPRNPVPCHEIASSKTPRNDTFGKVIPVTILSHFSSLSISLTLAMSSLRSPDLTL